MLKFVAIVMLLVSGLAFADSEVILQPGGEATITAGETTRVICEETSASTHFCSCGGNANNMGWGSDTLVRIDFINGVKHLSVLQYFESAPECQGALLVQPPAACR